MVGQGGSVRVKKKELLMVKGLKIKEIATVLDIDLDTILEKLDRNVNPDYFVPIVDMLSSDEKLSSLYNRESEGIVISTKESRLYHGGKTIR